MKKQWFETWFNSPYYDLLYKNRDVAEAKQFMDRLMNHLAPSPEANFLDLACGKGRHSMYLHSKGFQVEGADYSEENIRCAQQQNSRIHFFIHDMRQALDPESYDYILNLFTSFGYFKSDEEHQQTLDNVFNSLVPGGCFVMDFLNIEGVRKNLCQLETRTIDNIHFEIEKQISKGYIEKVIRFTHQGKPYIFEETVRAFSREELIELMQRTGFVAFELFGNYQLDPFDLQTSDRLIIIARK